MGLTITAERTKPDISILKLCGSLNRETYGLLDSEVGRAVAEPVRVLVLDMDGVGFLASSGIAAMLKARSSLAREHATLALINLQPQVRAVLEVIRILPMFTVFQGRNELDEYVGKMPPPSVRT